MNETTPRAITAKPGKPGRVPLALTVGFVAGALFARRPAAALVALATGLLASTGARRKDSLGASRDEEPAAGVEDPVCAPLAPLPELGESDLCSPAAPVNQLASLSLPAIAPQPFPASKGNGSLQAKPRATQPVRLNHIPGTISVSPVPGAAEKANVENLPGRRS